MHMMQCAFLKVWPSACCWCRVVGAVAALPLCAGDHGGILVDGAWRLHAPAALLLCRVPNPAAHSASLPSSLCFNIHVYGSLVIGLQTLGSSAAVQCVKADHAAARAVPQPQHAASLYGCPYRTALSGTTSGAERSTAAVGNDTASWCPTRWCPSCGERSRVRLSDHTVGDRWVQREAVSCASRVV